MGSPLVVRMMEIPYPQRKDLDRLGSGQVGEPVVNKIRRKAGTGSEPRRRPSFRTSGRAKGHGCAGLPGSASPAQPDAGEQAARAREQAARAGDLGARVRLTASHQALRPAGGLAAHKSIGVHRPDQLI